jgi:hypothetical protein
VQFADQAAERPKIDLKSVTFAQKEFRRAIIERLDGMGEGTGRVSHGAEVYEFDVGRDAVALDDIFRFEIAMDESAAMDDCERPEELAGDGLDEEKWEAQEFARLEQGIQIWA